LVWEYVVIVGVDEVKSWVLWWDNHRRWGARVAWAVRKVSAWHGSRVGSIVTKKSANPLRSSPEMLGHRGHLRDEMTA